MLLDIATTAMPEFALHLHPWSGHEVFSLDPGQCSRLRIFVTQIISSHHTEIIAQRGCADRSCAGRNSCCRSSTPGQSWPARLGRPVATQWALPPAVLALTCEFSYSLVSGLFWKFIRHFRFAFDLQDHICELLTGTAIVVRPWPERL